MERENRQNEIRRLEQERCQALREYHEAAEKLAALYRDPALYRAIQEGCERSARAYDSDAVFEKLTKEMA